MRISALLSFLMILLACEKEEELSLSGNWQLNNIQCDTYSYFQEYRLSIFDEDSLWGVLVKNDSDSIPFLYSYEQESYLSIDSSQSDFWNGRFTIIEQGNRSLRITVQNDSCAKSEWLFKK